MTQGRGHSIVRPELQSHRRCSHYTGPFAGRETNVRVQGKRKSRDQLQIHQKERTEQNRNPNQAKAKRTQTKTKQKQNDMKENKTEQSSSKQNKPKENETKQTKAKQNAATQGVKHCSLTFKTTLIDRTWLLKRRKCKVDGVICLAMTVEKITTSTEKSNVKLTRH